MMTAEEARECGLGCMRGCIFALGIDLACTAIVVCVVLGINLIVK